MFFKTILLVALTSFTVFADWTKIKSTDFELAPPPTKDTAAYKRDFKILLELQESRTEEECALSNTQTQPTFETLYGSSELLSENEMDHVAPLLNKTFSFAERVSNYFKAKYMRPRPFNTNPDIKPCVQKPAGSKSYPSSHAAMSTLGACVLSKIYPSRTKAIIAYGKMLSLLRVKVGVHHPSDVEAGQELANAMCVEISKAKDFKEEVSELK